FGLDNSSRPDNALTGDPRPRFWPLQDLVFVRGFMGVKTTRSILTQKLSQTCFADVIRLPHAWHRAINLLARLSIDDLFAHGALQATFVGGEHPHDTHRMWRVTSCSSPSSLSHARTSAGVACL